MKLSLIFIRHGMTAGNEQQRYIGQSEDQPLSPRGKEELVQFKKQGRYPQPQAVYVSPLLRCKETTQIIYPMLVPVVIPALIEINMGIFEGNTYEFLKNDAAYRAWIATGGQTAPPGGESQAEIHERLQLALRQVAEEAQRCHITCAAVVTHGGCIMNLFGGMAAMPDANVFSYVKHNGGGYTADLDTESLVLSNIRSL